MCLACWQRARGGWGASGVMKRSARECPPIGIVNQPRHREFFPEQMGGHSRAPHCMSTRAQKKGTGVVFSINTQAVRNGLGENDPRPLFSPGKFIDRTQKALCSWSVRRAIPSHGSHLRVMSAAPSNGQSTAQRAPRLDRALALIARSAMATMPAANGAWHAVLAIASAGIAGRSRAFSSGYQCRL